MSRSGAFTVGTVVMTFAAFPVYVAALALASQSPLWSWLIFGAYVVTGVTGGVFGWCVRELGVIRRLPRGPRAFAGRQR